MSAFRCCGKCKNPHTSDCAHRACKCCAEKKCKCHNGPDAELLDYLTKEADS